MNAEPVSVVMTVRNGARFVPEQLSSMLADLRRDDEVVVIDDASTDDSPAQIEAKHDRRVCLVRRAVNQGVRLSFQQGLQLARHSIVFLCDQDDIWLQGKRAAFVEAFETDPRTLLVISDAEVIDSSGAVISPSFMATRGGFSGAWWSTLLRNRYLGCAMALRRSLLSAALPIPSQVPMHDMWLGALASLLGDVKYIATPLLRYRRHATNATPLHRQSPLLMLRWRLALVSALLSRLAAVKTGHDGLAPESGRKQQK